MNDDLSAKYKLECTHPGCNGQVIVTQNTGVSWRIGQLVGMDQTNPGFARCPMCLRHNMRVATAPPVPPPPKPKGFTKVPTT